MGSDFAQDQGHDDAKSPEPQSLWHLRRAWCLKIGRIGNILLHFFVISILVARSVGSNGHSALVGDSLFALFLYH
jgi:hypothetical protein